MNKIRAPFPYVGGKFYLLDRLLFLLDGAGAEVYVEPFCGAGWVFWNKRPHPIEVLNDLDGNIVNVYRCLQDEKAFVELSKALLFTPYSRKLYEEALSVLASQEVEPVRRAWAFLVAYGQGVGGMGVGRGAWGFTRSKRAHPAGKWVSRMEFLDHWHERLRGAYLECGDGLELIQRWDGDEVIFYVDPPYPLEARRGGKQYSCEMGEEEHSKLVEVLLSLRGKAVVSGYPGTVYERLGEVGWRSQEVSVSLSSTVVGRDRGRKNRAVEKIWWNYEEGFLGRV